MKSTNDAVDLICVRENKVPQKEDVLEQIVEEYLIHRGYFIQRNIKYRPDENDDEYESKKDSVRSDIDVLAFNPLLSGAKRVMAFRVIKSASIFER